MRTVAYAEGRRLGDISLPNVSNLVGVVVKVVIKYWSEPIKTLIHKLFNIKRHEKPYFYMLTNIISSMFFFF